MRSGLGRPIDIRLMSNRFAVVAAALAGLAAGGWRLFLTDDALARSVGGGFLAGAVSFFSWALLREIDPDRPWLAGVAGVTVPAALWWGDPSVWSLLFAMLVARVMARTTGVAPQAVDLVVVVGCGLTAVLVDGALVVAVAGAAGLGVDTVLPGEGRRRVVVSGVVLTGGAVVLSLAAVDPIGSITPTASQTWVFVGMGVFALVAATGPQRLRSAADRHDRPVLPRRVTAARLFVAAAGGALLLLHGGRVLASAATLLGAVALVGAADLVQLVMRSNSRRANRSVIPDT